MTPLAIILWSAVAALLSWHLANRQGRNAKAWALWTFLLSGLPLILLFVLAVASLPKFGLPKFGQRAHTCCADRSWEPVADLGHAGGVDFDLGRCANCGAHLMALFYGGSTTYSVISDFEAEQYLELQGTPELRKRLKQWVD